jgi:hypothetical protein
MKSTNAISTSRNYREIASTPKSTASRLDLLVLLSSLGLIWLDCIHSIKSIKPIKQACLLASLLGQNRVSLLHL